MSRNYEYDDADNIYTHPVTGVLHNKLGIDDPKLLDASESLSVSKRLRELRIQPIEVHSSSSLLAILAHLFQDIYSLAGKVRIVDISKEGRPFLPIAYFSRGFTPVDDLVASYELNNGEATEVAARLAEILDTVNYLHPFREGNGRRQREFVRGLALQKEFLLDLNPPDNTSVYDWYVAGTIEGDVELLTSLILEINSKQA